MKTKKRPLITKSDMKKIVSAAKRKRFDGKTVQVQALLREHYPDRPISGQMRRLVSAELDKAGVGRIRRIQSATIQEFLVKTTQKTGKCKLSENFLEDASQPSESIPGVLGGISANDSDVIDVTFTLGDELTADMDEFLAEEVRNGNRRALRLLKSQIRRG